ncbi:MAG: RHS repeat-associated core domain-containing protein [Lentisphaerae bacterium]|nr:RHS repeat-associated core domain-containing protein [Lentisphaerota bacterium]
MRTTWARGAWRQNNYDARRLLSAASYSAADTPGYEITFDAFGRPSAIVDDAGNAYRYAYDSNSAMTNETATTVNITGVFARILDQHGRPASTGLSVNGVEKSLSVYSYDAYGRISGIAVTNAHDRGLQVAYTNFAGRTMGHIATLPSEDVFSRILTRNGYRPNRITASTNAFNGVDVTQFTYDHDALDRVTRRNTDTFGYNMRSEVTSAMLSATAWSYSYDNAGNQTTSTVASALFACTEYTANNLNQYTSILESPAQVRTPGYDLDGNMVSDGAFGYAWDCENRLISVSSNGVPIASYEYDYLHRRISKTIHHPQSSVHSYIYDGWNLAHETIEVAGGAVSEIQYFWGTDLSGTLQGAGGVGGLLAVSIDGQYFLPCQDANGNVTEYINESGAVVAQYIYDAFGSTIGQSGPFADTFRFRFSTRYHDPETGFYYYGRRLYDPPRGRWLNRDPIEESGGLNLYAFCRNDGVNAVDAFGFRVYWPYIGILIEPTVEFDSDHNLPFPDTPTAEDYKWWDVLGKMITIAEKFMPDAVRAYRHYRSGAGTDLTVDYEKAYRTDRGIRADIDDAIYEAASEAERLFADVKKGDSSGWRMSSNAELSGQPTTQNWQKTLGVHHIWGSAEMQLCNEKFKMWLTLHALDRYNFNEGDKDLATGLPDNVNRRFSQLSWAKGFVTRGTINRIVSWERGRPYKLTIKDKEGSKP